ncbi:hypothetical protein [Cylindrospermum stagnale]|uniref:hypothetical protein n=1 Tax=Cylindrospermum stagnale TaxID=142864 RepID=UPI0012F646AB|nr:hypothetical protein [Cylindrospermum stagnale]
MSLFRCIQSPIALLTSDAANRLVTNECAIAPSILPALPLPNGDKYSSCLLHTS